jgi:enamine deaminase RidA (YjgF/YER057c/UK114 family)
VQFVNPESWPRPRGYNNGVAATGTLLFIAGQIGWNERAEFVSNDFLAQAAQALRNVVAVVRAAGGAPENVARLTWYVTDKREYLAAAKALGDAYRETFGEHYPAMTLVVVAALLEDRAKVEIEATVVLETR